MKFTVLFLCAFLLSCKANTAQREPGALQKVGIVNAASHQAVCLDGSPAAYYMEQGKGTGLSTWIIHFEGGGRCGTLAECDAISAPYKSANNWEVSLLGKGVLSDIYSENPYLYQSNHVLLRQCSGDGWTGTNQLLLTSGNNYHFLGSVIFKRIIQDLIDSKGLAQAKRVLLSGASSGAQGVFQHLDWLSARLPQTQVKGIVDAGYFFNTAVYAKAVNALPIQMSQYHTLSHSIADAGCAAANQADLSQCMFPEIVLPYITTPIMIKDSQYDRVILEKYGVFLPYDGQEQSYVYQYAAGLKASLSNQSLVFSDTSSRHTTLVTKGFVRRKVGSVFLYDFLGRWFNQGYQMGSVIE